MNSNSLTPGLKALFATVTAGVTGTLVYHYLRTNVFTNDEQVEESWDILHVEIPRETIAYLIGRNGINIKQVEEKTCTSISFIDQGGPCKIGVIRGHNPGVQSAKEELLKSIEECAHLETTEILVSEKTITQLAADDKKKLREIVAMTKARIYIEGAHEKPTSLLVRGTYHQIEKVRDCLKLMIVDDGVPLEVEKGNNLIPKRPTSATRIDVKGTFDYEKLEPTSSDGYCEVMLSMVESPSRFFIQKAGPLSKELDCLIEEMTDFYSKKSDCSEFFSSKYEVGGFVAALVPDDNSWYRAKVVSVDSDDTCQDESIIHVELVDFGDVVPVKQRYVANLRPDFLTMRFQGIECTLADVHPIGDSDWTEKAIEMFETMTYCTQWKILMARVESNFNLDGKLIPALKLVDTNTEKDIDIAAELVRLELAAHSVKS